MVYPPFNLLIYLYNEATVINPSVTARVKMSQNVDILAKVYTVKPYVQ